jgi:hypothetical protein
MTHKEKFMNQTVMYTCSIKEAINMARDLQPIIIYSKYQEPLIEQYEYARDWQGI